MLGEKGIGRFAAARLGRFTKLESTHSSGDSCSLVTVDIDWNWFTAEKYLDEIDIPVEETKLFRRARRFPEWISILLTSGINGQKRRWSR